MDQKVRHERLCKKVKVTSLKPLVRSYLRSGSALRELILSQPDEMDALDYVVKVGDWLSLLNMEVGVSKGDC